MAEKLYNADPSKDHTDLLLDIISLSKVGVASTDTLMNIRGLESAQCCLFETIFAKAQAAIEIAEEEQAATHGAKGENAGK